MKVNDPQKISLRKATQEDAKILFEWRNHPDVRAQSKNSEALNFSKHTEWLESVFANPNRHLYVAELGGQAVGTCRADFNGERYELSWTVAPAHQKKGLGLKLVQELCSRHRPFLARIKTGNLASIKIAETLLMTKLRNEGEFLEFVGD